MNLSLCTIYSDLVLLYIIVDTTKWWIFSIFQFKRKPICLATSASVNLVDGDNTSH